MAEADIAGEASVPRQVAPAQPAARPGGGGPTHRGPVAEGREALASAVRQASSAKEQAEKLVYTWPHLVMIEFLSALLMLLSLIIMAWVINAPLEGHADPDRTPNPSKAPWYFLNLQELLLHMHPSLSGVIIPGVVVFVLLPLIPYLDRDTSDVGKWFGAPRSKEIAVFSAIYTSIVLPAMILFDEYVGTRPMMLAIAGALNMPFLADTVFTGWIVPLIFMFVPIVVLLLAINKLYRPTSMRQIMVALFTGFLVTYAILTVVGTFFRGRGMHLYWPWDPNMVRME